MKINRLAAVLIITGVALVSSIPLASQTKGLRSISVEDMKYHLRFLGAKEFEGRNAPSVGLNVASRYIALVAEKYGLKPLLPGGSYYQELPLEVSTLSASRSYLRLETQTGEEKFLFPEAFGMNVRLASPGTVSGELIFLGYGLHAPESNWDDYGETDVKGKIAVILDADLPQDHVLKPAQNRALLSLRGRAARSRGAVSVIFVIGQEREKSLAAKGIGFDRRESVKFLDLELDQQMSFSPAGSTAPFYEVDVRHDVAATILGIPRRDLDQMFETVSQGKRVTGRELPGKTLEIKIALEKRKAATENVVGYLEGSDPRLKSEYIVIGSHHDHIGTREGKIFPGADDNASGAVAMLELVRAIKAERPKRSVIFVWHTAEEKGLVGAYYFLAHCPVPVDRISADLNLDMVTRNDPNAVYLIGSNKLSTELDGSIRAENGRSVRLKLDYAYQEPDHPDRFFFRSDQFPYIRYGIPGVWFFSGTTEDYHQETDDVEKCDFRKMEKITRLVYLVAWDIGNKPSLLKLDINPEITTRGKQNFGFNWFKVREEKTQKQKTSQASDAIAIRNVRLFDGDKVSEKQTVVFKGGQIAAVGAAIPIPEGAESIDGSGKTLLPGLIDSHTHIFGSGLEQSLVFGVTTDIDMFTDIKFVQETKKEQASGGAPNKSEMISPGTLVTAPGGHGTQYGLPIPTIRSPQEAQAFVDARIAEGADFIKIIYDRITPAGPMIDKETLTAVISAAHRRGKMAVVHVTTYERALEAVRAGADGLAHVFADVLPKDGIDSLVEKRHFFLIPTLTVIKGVCGLTQEESFLKDKSLEPYLSPADLTRLKQTFPSARPAPDRYAIAEKAVRELKAKKVLILAGTDAPNPGTVYGASLHEELSLLIKAGLKPVEALAAATSVPAATFGLKDRGRIAPGLRADLVLVKGNPLEDIKATRDIETIWKGGVRVDRAAYQKEIEEQKKTATTLSSAAQQDKTGSGLISDFEDGKPSSRFGTGWAVSTDTYAGGKSRGEIKVVADGADGTSKSLLVTGDVAPGLAYAWSGVVFFPGEVPFAPVDLSSRKEITFWAKGDGKNCRLLIYTQGGGFMPASQTFKLEKEWKNYIFRLSDFGGTDGHDITGISFAAGPDPGPYSFQVDEIALK